jgi:hypothetical protein
MTNRSHHSARPRMLAEVKMLADNLHHLPGRSQRFALSLIAVEAHRAAENRSEIGHGLTEKQLRQVVKLIERIKREKTRLGSLTTCRRGRVRDRGTPDHE